MFQSLNHFKMYLRQAFLIEASETADFKARERAGIKVICDAIYNDTPVLIPPTGRF